MSEFKSIYIYVFLTFLGLINCKDSKPSNYSDLTPKFNSDSLHSDIEKNSPADNRDTIGSPIEQSNNTTLDDSKLKIYFDNQKYIEIKDKNNIKKYELLNNEVFAAVSLNNSYFLTSKHSNGDKKSLKIINYKLQNKFEAEVQSIGFEGSDQFIINNDGDVIIQNGVNDDEGGGLIRIFHIDSSNSSLKKNDIKFNRSKRVGSYFFDSPARTIFVTYIDQYKNSFIAKYDYSGKLIKEVKLDSNCFFRTLYNDFDSKYFVLFANIKTDFTIVRILNEDLITIIKDTVDLVGNYNNFKISNYQNNTLFLLASGGPNFYIYNLTKAHRVLFCSKLSDTIKVSDIILFNGNFYGLGYKRVRKEVSKGYNQVNIKSNCFFQIEEKQCLILKEFNLNTKPSFEIQNKELYLSDKDSDILLLK